MLPINRLVLTTLRGLQTNGQVFSNFKLVFELKAKKKKKNQTNRGVNFDQISMRYLSMNSS